MKTDNFHEISQTISAILLFLAVFGLPCAIVAQDRVILRFHSVEDPGQHLVSRSNLELALAFAFNSRRFDELWPRYGYSYSEVADNIAALCTSQNRNIGLGRSAIAWNDPQEQDTFIALPMDDGTDPDIVQNFLNAHANSAIRYSGSGDTPGDTWTSTIGDMCRILSDSHPDSPGDVVIVTQRPLPFSERYSYRLREEGTLEPGTVSE